MTAEQLHDAISLLPADLIAEADRKRTVRRSPVRWQRYAAMAACFALMVCGSLWCFSILGTDSAKEAAAEVPAAMMQSAPEIMAAAPREEASDTAADTHSGSGENSTACLAATPSVTLQIEGRDYPLTGEDMAALARLLAQLDFRTEDVCECIADITVLVADTPEYHINLEEGFIRCARGQSLLTQEEILLIQTIVDTLVS